MFLYPPGSRRRNVSIRSESAGLIARPGVGVASYISAMNKDKHRKISAPSLRGSLDSKGNETDVTPVSSEESLGQSTEQQEATINPAPAKKFQVQKTRAVSLAAITPTLKDIDCSTPKREVTVESSYDMEPSVEKRNDEISRFAVRSTSKTKLIDEIVNEDKPEIIRNNETIAQQKRKKFTIKKCDSDSKLVLMSTDGSIESLSSVVGRLKDEEVFF